MQHSRTLRGITACIAIFFSCVLAGCNAPPPEQAVRAQIEALQQAIDQRDAGAVHDLLSADFIGNQGMDRRGARQLAAGAFLRHARVHAVIGGVEVELRGQRDAIARFSVLLTGGNGTLLPQRGQAYRVETGWRLIDDQWQLRSAHWDAQL